MIIREPNSVADAPVEDAATLKQQVFARHHKGSKKTHLSPKSTIVVSYMGVFLLIMSMVAIGYQPPKQSTSVANIAGGVSAGAKSGAGQPSVDQIVATNVAANIASQAKLPIAPNVANQSVSLTVQSQVAQTNTETIAKPQIVQSSQSRVVKAYTAKKGDTATTIAEQFGVTTNTIKWANDLSGDDVAEGKELKVLPVDGVLYTVKGDDSLTDVASKFNTSVDTITAFNDLELTGLVKDQQIILPSGVLPEEDRPGYVAPQAPRAAAPSFTGVPYGTVRFAGGFMGGSMQVISPYNLIPGGRNIYTATNGGANGQCTWWAIERRAAMGRALPSGALGNASDWVYTLAGRYAINQTPARGAVIQNGGGYGHVGVVESVNADGSLTISEMNNYAAGGNFVVNVRTIPASAAGNFNYIH